MQGRLCKHLFRERLAEKNGTRLQDTVTYLTVRVFFAPIQPGPDLLERIVLMAAQAYRPLRITMQLKDPIIGQACLLVQIVNVLGNDAVQPAQPIKLGDGIVCRVGLGDKVELA